jgi:hypothetical protein
MDCSSLDGPLVDAPIPACSTSSNPSNRIAIRLSVGSLEDLALGRVVPEQLLNQVDVGEQHAAAAVAVESQFGERRSIITSSSQSRDSSHHHDRFGFFAREITYPSSIGWCSASPSISLTYLVQRSPTTCFREKVVVSFFLGRGGD